MNIINSIKKIFKIDEPAKEESEEILKCPHCGNAGWQEGPSGGGSVNIKCNRCGSKYNYMGSFELDELEIRNDHKDYLRDKKIDDILKK